MYVLWSPHYSYLYHFFFFAGSFQDVDMNNVVAVIEVTLFTHKNLDRKEVKI